MVLRKGFTYLFIFLALVFIFSDIIFGLNIIFKTKGITLYKSPAGIFLVIMCLFMAISSINDYFSRVNIFFDKFQLKTFFGTKTVLFKDISKLTFAIKRSGSSALGYFIFYDKDGNRLCRLPNSFFRSHLIKKQFIIFLINHIPGLKIDKYCEKIISE
jgi:hypothetical protein